MLNPFNIRWLGLIAWRSNRSPSFSMLSNSLLVDREGGGQDTSCRWRHRFLWDAAAHHDARESGIIEADETFFLESLKGPRKMPRPSRKRGGVSNTRGTGPDQIPVLVVRNREGRTATSSLQQLCRPGWSRPYPTIAERATTEGG